MSKFYLYSKYMTIKRITSFIDKELLNWLEKKLSKKLEKTHRQFKVKTKYKHRQPSLKSLKKRFEN